ncbi:hypothetical protein F443_07696 [Phytophthora nicotianae P1569]|uniref:Uncharacterized protein n=1 Tax=Phytophthora nicotianae P1569 TaxID=1317065 RepID=V9F9S9_PHYNI|nr:hypothetical protein F443_07696 [Phytophthora nicotianae P1569]
MYKGVRIWLECAKCVANQIAQSANTGEEKSPKVYEFGRPRLDMCRLSRRSHSRCFWRGAVAPLTLLVAEAVLIPRR